MWSVCFTYLLVFVVAFEDAKAQDYTEFYRRLAGLKRPIIISADGSRKYYENPKRDISHQETHFENPKQDDNSEHHEIPKQVINYQQMHQMPGGAEASQIVTEKIHMDIYYETDCPDSMRFIREQFYPVYKTMGNNLDVNLYPYGKTYRYFDEETKKYKFSCHHGPSECYGNMVQACSLKLLSLDSAIELINCMESYPRPSQSAQKCARKLNQEWEKIDKCVTGEVGYNAMMYTADETEKLNPQLYFVPWVVFDGVFNAADHRKAQRDLKGVVCKKYQGRHPSCGNKPPA